MAKAKVNGIEMYYKIQGKGKPLVLISGLTGDHTGWDTVVDKFAKHYQVITFDNRGVGQTDAPNTPYTLKLMAEDTITLINHLKLQKPHIVGSSMGGGITQMLGVHYGNKVDKLVILCSTAKWREAFCFVADLRLSFYKENISKETFVKTIMPWVFSSKFLEDKKNVSDAIKLTLEDPHPQTEIGYKRQLEALKKFDSRKELSKIKNPTLILAGEEDIIALIKEGKELADKIPNSQYHCFKGTAHLPNLEMPDNFVKKVLDFLTKD